MRWELAPEIVRLIRAKKADYVLALKTNHPTLHALGLFHSGIKESKK